LLQKIKEIDPFQTDNSFAKSAFCFEDTFEKAPLVQRVNTTHEELKSCASMGTTTLASMPDVQTQPVRLGSKETRQRENRKSKTKTAKTLPWKRKQTANACTSDICSLELAWS
jgi:seryl-tRNA synthetase